MHKDGIQSRWTARQSWIIVIHSRGLLIFNKGIYFPRVDMGNNWQIRDIWGLQDQTTLLYSRTIHSQSPQETQSCPLRIQISSIQGVQLCFHDALILYPFLCQGSTGTYIDIILFQKAMISQFIQSEDQQCASSPISGSNEQILEQPLNNSNFNKMGGLQNLDTKYKQLQEFIQNLPLKLRCPVRISVSHPDIEVPQLEESVTGQRLLQLAQNTIRKMKNHKRLKKNWNKEDLTIMLWVADKYNQLHAKSLHDYKTKDWRSISEYIPGKSRSQCMFKWLSLKKHHLIQHPWTLDEQVDLKTLVEQKGQSNWPEISQQLYLIQEGRRTFRSAKQCREHWTCYVNPNLKKGLWKPIEDLQLLSQFIKLGKKWAQISKVLNGRTENAIKNRFNLLMEKQGELKGSINLQNRRQYALRIINSIQATYGRSYNIQGQGESQQIKHEEQERESPVNFFDKEEREILSLDKMEYRIFNSNPEPFPAFSQIDIKEVKVQNYQQAVIRKVKFCRVSLGDLMEIQGVVPAVFDRDTLEIFLDDNNTH